MKKSKYLHSVLTVIAVLLAGNLWVGMNPSPSATQTVDGRAIAQGRTDAGQQRAEMIAQLKSLKSSVDDLSQKLTSGSITVKVEGGADKD